MKRRMGAAIAGLAFTLVALFAPTSAFASAAVEEPIVSVSTHDELNAVYLEWYTAAEADTVEVVATDAAGGITTRTAPAEQLGMSFTGVRAGGWTASVTAISQGARSTAVPVWIQVDGAPAPASPAPGAISVAPSTAPSTPTPTATAATAARLQFSLTPGPDGTASGATVGIDGAGLAPSSTFTVTVAASGAVLLEGSADVDGAVAAQVALPADLVAGDHVLLFTGTGAAGDPVTGEYTITIEAAPAEEAVAAPVAPVAPAEGGLDEILSLSGDAAVPYLVGGAIAATAATGAVAGAAASVSIRIRRLKLTRLLDLEYPGTGTGGATGGRGVLGGILDLVTKLRGGG